MKRDMDLIRQLLIELEAYPEWPATEVLISEDPVRQYHFHLLIQAGLIEGEEIHVMGAPTRFLIHGLSWSGHEFLAVSSDQNRWERFKNWAGAGLTSIPFPVITRLLSDGIEQSVRSTLQSHGFMN